MSSQDKKRGDHVASSRSRLVKKGFTRSETGQQAQDEFTEMITKMLKGLETQLEVEPNVNTLNNMLNKKNEKKLN
tara:strand:+ start:725 stop:949 length:225 start_codon:yes stop_codon:yes gene_type:complete